MSSKAAKPQGNRNALVPPGARRSAGAIGKGWTLSIVMPCYNERKLLPECLKLVEKAPLPRGIRREIILVDDCSTDGTREWLQALCKKGKHKVLFHERNRGKGAAVKTGFAAATGDILLVQDADLEYDPRDYPALVTPIIRGKALVVYGSRRLRKNKKYASLAFYLGGVLLNWLSTLLYGQVLTDEATCYKAFRADVIRSMRIRGERFEWEPEVTAKVRKRGIRILEVPIRYYPRSVAEGKKIKWKDGIEAVWTLFRYRFFD